MSGASSVTRTPGTTTAIGPTDTKIYTTDTITGTAAVPVDERPLLEQRAAEFELIDPRSDPARYLALSTKYCRQSVQVQEVREYATARPSGNLTEPEARQLELIERGTHVVEVKLFGFLGNAAKVRVRLEGDPSDGSGRPRDWTLEDGDWRVASCSA